MYPLSLLLLPVSVVHCSVMSSIQDGAEKLAKLSTVNQQVVTMLLPLISESSNADQLLKFFHRDTRRLIYNKWSKNFDDNAASQWADFSRREEFNVTLAFPPAAAVPLSQLLIFSCFLKRQSSDSQFPCFSVAGQSSKIAPFR